jgi:hypothetical protein
MPRKRRNGTRPGKTRSAATVGPAGVTAQRCDAPRSPSSKILNLRKPVGRTGCRGALISEITRCCSTAHRGVWKARPRVKLKGGRWSTHQVLRTTRPPTQAIGLRGRALAHHLRRHLSRFGACSAVRSVNGCRLINDCSLDLPPRDLHRSSPGKWFISDQEAIAGRRFTAKNRIALPVRRFAGGASRHMGRIGA